MMIRNQTYISLSEDGGDIFNQSSTAAVTGSIQLTLYSCTSSRLPGLWWSAPCSLGLDWCLVDFFVQLLVRSLLQRRCIGVWTRWVSLSGWFFWGSFSQLIWGVCGYYGLGSESEQWQRDFMMIRGGQQ